MAFPGPRQAFIKAVAKELGVEELSYEDFHTVTNLYSRVSSIDPNLTPPNVAEYLRDCVKYSSKRERWSSFRERKENN